jgi:hypothetical protein
MSLTYGNGTLGTRELNKSDALFCQVFLVLFLFQKCRTWTVFNTLLTQYRGFHASATEHADIRRQAITSLPSAFATL